MVPKPAIETQVEFLSGGGDMGALIRAFDWSRTTIGPPDAWSPGLRTMVRVLLANRFPMLLWWGSEYVSIYNDAYIPVLGRKHPAGLGLPVRECWSEIWDVLKPLIDTPFYGGPATWIEDIELHINRAGFTEETHFTVAYSPVPDETTQGGIGGVLATVHEITEKVIGNRRANILRDLGTRAAESKTAEDSCIAAMTTMGGYPKDIPFALLYLLSPDGKQAHLAASCGVDATRDLAPAVINLDESAQTDGWPLAEALRTEQLWVVENLAMLFSTLPAGTWPEPPHTAVVAPIRSNIAHQLSGFLVAGLSSHLSFDGLYRNFLDLATLQIATAIANARAYEQERRRSEALAEIDRAKTAFFSNVSHEFRTPLTLMLGPLESLLAKSDRLPAEDRAQIEIAHRNSLRLLQLVNSLLDFSRIEAGRVKACFTPVDLAAVTMDLSANFRSAMHAAGLEFVVDCVPLGEPVYVDIEMWEKIVLNLLSNAFKFTFEGRVTVSVRADGNHATLTVADTGTGIPPSELPHIFERFHRVEGARGRSYEGTGIGLALIHELVRIHGGRVGVSSNLGEGSTFTVTLPFGTAHLPVVEAESTVRSQISTAARAEAFAGEALTWVSPKDPPHLPEQYQVAGARLRIVVADDNADMRDHISSILGSDYELVMAADGEQALEHIRESPPDLLLTDIMMPGLDGFELLRVVRADSATQTIPVIFLSARAGEEARVDGLGAGADDYLVKPFTAKELIARVKTHLRMAQMRKSATEREAVLRAEAEAARDAVLKSNAQLRRANADLEQFAYSASHDLQEPLRSVSIYSELLENRCRERLDDKSLEFLEFLRGGAARMGMLVHDLLAYTQVTNLDAVPEETKAEEALGAALSNLSEAIAESKAQVTYSPLPQLPVHSTHLQQLFQNLIGNAMKYRKPGEAPRVHVSAESQDSSWLFSVCDNGIGIDPRYKERIFGIFKRLHTGDEYSGTGIGLAICQRIVERYQGRIWVESQQGEGSTFRFTLPA